MLRRRGGKGYTLIASLSPMAENLDGATDMFTRPLDLRALLDGAD